MRHVGYPLKAPFIFFSVVILQVGLYALYLKNFPNAPQIQSETSDYVVSVSMYVKNETRYETRSETLSEIRSETRTETRSEIWSETRSDTQSETRSEIWSETRSANGTLTICPLVSPHLVGPIHISPVVLPLRDIAKLNPSMKLGRYKPAKCISRNRVAIIIPYRDRADHLKVLLHNLVPVLMRQQLDFGVYLVEQVNGTGFNRGTLMNIGFTVASRAYDYQCFVFHDVDLMPENDRTLYSCPDQPRQLSVLLNKWDYKIRYGIYFGGVTAFSKEHFTKINGYSNKFFGWGAEDDDLRNRVVKSGLKKIRYNDTLSRYHMIRHKQAVKNPDLFKLRASGHKRFKIDGLNSLKYNVLETDYQPLFTRILVNINKTEVMTN